MRRNWLFGTVTWTLSLFQKFEERLYADRARLNAWQWQEELDEVSASGLFGDGRLADEQDAEEAGMYTPGGLWLGSLAGRLMFWHGEGHLLAYAMTGGGKGVSYVIPNLCFVHDRTIILTDGKDGENAWATAKYRKETLETEVIFINPDGLYGFPTTRINPCQRIIDVARAGTRFESEAQEVTKILIPEKPDQKEQWPQKGAVRLLYTWMEWKALTDPDFCTLPDLWRFINSSVENFELVLGLMAVCDHAGIAGRAEALIGTYSNSKEQFEAYRSEAADALTTFEPGKLYADAVGGHDYDFSQIKKKPHTIYIMSASEKAEIAAPFVGLVTHYLIEAAAKATGPLGVTFLLDEFPILPKIDAVPKAMRLYRGRNVQLWLFSQGRHSLRQKWGEAAVADFEDQASVMLLSHVQDTSLYKDLGVWSGQTTVVSRNSSYSGGTVESANLSMQEQRRAVLQPEQISRLTVNGGQIIKVRKVPYLFAAQMEPFYKVREFRAAIGDTRKLHRGEG